MWSFLKGSKDHGVCEGPVCLLRLARLLHVCDYVNIYIVEDPLFGKTSLSDPSRATIGANEAQAQPHPPRHSGICVWASYQNSLPIECQKYCGSAYKGIAGSLAFLYGKSAIYASS